MTRRVLILGITGQDGSYLADLLLEKGCEVHGLVRHSSSYPDNLWRIEHALDRLTLHSGDLTDPASVYRIIDEVRPAELYNEADQDHVGTSYATPAYSMDVTAGAVARTLEAVRRIDPAIRVFQPVSATMFGTTPPPQNEGSAFAPQSPYAVAKVSAYYLCQHFRREYGMFVSTATLFNHDSPRRVGDYLLHKLCRAAVRGEPLALGCLDQRVDIGYAPEYVAAMHRLMQLDQPADVVLSSGDTWTIRELARHAYAAVGLDFEQYVTEAPYRPGPVPYLFGDSRKATKLIGWKPTIRVDHILDLLIDHYRSLSHADRSLSVC